MDDPITLTQLSAFIDDALSEVEMARIEKALRNSPELRERLEEVREQQDRGEHSFGAIWRRERLSCISREQLTQYLLELLSPEVKDYIQFHLETIACPYCNANLNDLREKHAEANPKTKQRRKQIFDSTIGRIGGE
jgi:hypothetical protein